MVNSQNTRRKEAISNQVRRSLLRVSIARVRIIRWVLMTIALMEAINYNENTARPYAIRAANPNIPTPGTIQHIKLEMAIVLKMT